MIPPVPTVTSARSSYGHRGFDLRLCPGGSGQFAFEVGHLGLTLHASEAAFRTPVSAERAARRFVDDALGSYDHAARSLAA